MKEINDKKARYVMSSLVVLEQMVIIFLLIGTGVILYRKKMLSEPTSKQLSGLIVNVTNPALLICSAFDEGPKVSLEVLGTALGCYALVYALLIAVGFLIPWILRIPQKSHYAYRMLSVFGNVGFIGIPLASAVLGTESLIFVAIYNLLFNLLIYTFGITLLQKAANRENPNSDTSVAKAGRVHMLINAGTISAALTVLFYLGDFPVPVIISSTLSYAGRATTLLSMLVLGVSVAQISLRELFSKPKLYAFTLIRQILVPIGCVLLFGIFIKHTLILNTLLLMVAVPAGNMPLMLAKQLDMETDDISQGIILTTILSLATVPVVCVFLR